MLYVYGMNVSSEVIYIIRHAEKPLKPPLSGVDFEGGQNEHSLLPRGSARPADALICDADERTLLSAHSFAPTTTYELVWDKRRYPPKAILGTAYEFATGQRLTSGDFEGGKSGAVRVLGRLGFTIQERRPAS
jgi:hypothetical protein